jgi:hypothetical protein
LILEQEALDLVVVDTDGNYDSAESAIVSGETATHFLRSLVEVAKGDKGIDAGTD